MSFIDEKAKNLLRQLRYSWVFLSLALIFIFILWTFQLVLILRFQTFWPSKASVSYTVKEVMHGRINYGMNVHSRNVLSHQGENYVNQAKVKMVCYHDIHQVFQDSHEKKTESSPDFPKVFKLCSHLIIAFANVENATVVTRASGDGKIYQDIISLKQKISPETKVFLSVGGMSIDGTFSYAVASEELRKKFADSAVQFLMRYQFDGIDLDWEFPSWPDDNLQQRRNFTLLLKELDSAFKKGNTSLELSVAVGAPAAILLQCYDIADMANYVSFVNLMSYDFFMYTRVTPVTGPNSPLYARPDVTTYLATLNTNWSASHWLYWGMPPEKLIVGIPTYGHSYKLLNEDNNGWGAPAAGFGSTGVDGFISTAQACNFIKQPRTTHVFDSYYQVPYAFSGQEWISYESQHSVSLKGDFVKQNGLGGAMIFSVQGDDMAGECGLGPYPLMQAVFDALYSGER